MRARKRAGSEDISGKMYLKWSVRALQTPCLGILVTNEEGSLCYVGAS